MKKLYFLIFIVGINLSFAQTKDEIGYLINEISGVKNSKDIIKSEAAKKLVKYDWKILPILSEFFTDTKETNVYSDCHKRNLNFGEIAIILADRIEGMPYAPLTGIQNCILQFCDNNPNLIEYYLPAIGVMGVDKFQNKYFSWLNSDDYFKYSPVLSSKSKRERRKILKEKENAKDVLLK